jgi:hypothetical protein
MNGKGTRFKSGIEIPYNKLYYTKSDGTVGTINLEELNLEEIVFSDGKYAKFGTGEDISMNFDGTNFELEGIAAATPYNIGAAGKVLDITQHGKLTIGVDGTGYDVKFYGATSGKYFMWDESADKVVLVGAMDMTGALTIGVDGTGHDVMFYGDTTEKYFMWDASADKLIVAGTSDLGSSCEADAYTVGGVAGVDYTGTIANITIVKGIVTAVS